MKRILISMLICTLVLALAMPAFAEYKVNESMPTDPVTLTLYGPGVFTAVSEQDTTDLVTGKTKVGYHAVIERWNELYPQCTLDIQPLPWSNWQPAVQAACEGGDVDIILHGATMTALTEDLAPYLASDPEYAAEINGTSARRTEDAPNAWKVSGIPYHLSPVLVWLDKDIFEHYGIDLPDSSWTYADMEELAAKLTGTDPVTGQQTYGVQLLQMGATNIYMNHMIIAQSLGAEIFTYGDTIKDCVVNYNSAESIEAFDIIRRLAQYCSPEAREGLALDESLTGGNNFAMIFLQGTTGYTQMTSSGLSGRYVPINPPCITAGKYAGMPSGTLGDNNLAIYKDAKDKEWAWEFIKFMTTDTEMMKWLGNLSYLPNSKNAYEAIASQMLPEYAEVYMYVMSNYPEYTNGATNSTLNSVSFGPVVANLTTAVSNVINGFSTPEEAAAFMQAGVDEYLAGLN